MITEILVNNGTLKEDPPIEEDINKDKEESKQDKDKQETVTQLPPDGIVIKYHPLDKILGNIKKDISTRSQVNNLCKYSIFISQIELKIISDTLLNNG